MLLKKKYNKDSLLAEFRTCTSTRDLNIDTTLSLSPLSPLISSKGSLNYREIV